MAIDERSRRTLERRLEESLGEGAAMTLMEYLPRGAPATREDLDAMEQRVDGRFEVMQHRMDRRFDAMETRLDRMDTRMDRLDVRFDGIDARFDGIDARFDGIDARLDGIDTRFTAVDENALSMEQRLNERIDLRTQSMADQVTTALHKEIMTQSRLYMFATVGAIASVAGVVAVAS